MEFPGKFQHILFKLPEVGGLEVIKSHQDSIWGPEMKVGSITPRQSAPEFNTARDDLSVLYIGWKDGDFPGAERFKTRRSCGEKGVFPADDMSFDPLLSGGVLGHSVPFRDMWLNS
jgi:hypothetical protein